MKLLKDGMIVVKSEGVYLAGYFFLSGGIGTSTMFSPYGEGKTEKEAISKCRKRIKSMGFKVVPICTFARIV